MIPANRAQMGFFPVSLRNAALAVADLARSVSFLASTFPIIAFMPSGNGAFLAFRGGATHAGPW